MTQIEQFYVEELIYKEHIDQIQDNEHLLNKLNENACLNLYYQWKDMASKLNLEQVDASAESFFSEPYSLSVSNEKTSVNVVQEEKATAESEIEPIKDKSNDKSEIVENLKTDEIVTSISPNSSHLDVTKDQTISQTDTFEDEMNKSMTELTSEITSNDKNMQNNSLISEPTEFLKCIEKLMVSTQTVGKHLDNIQKHNKEFVEFEKQDLKLNAIKQTLESLALALKTCMLHKKVIMEKSNKETARSISKRVTSLVQLHQSVVAKYKEKDSIYLKNYDKWVEFNKDFINMNEWLDSTLEKLNELNSSDLENKKLNDIIKVKFKIFLFSLV